VSSGKVPATSQLVTGASHEPSATGAAECSQDANMSTRAEAAARAILTSSGMSIVRALWSGAHGVDAVPLKAAISFSISMYA